MERRFAPKFLFLLLFVLLINAIPAHTGGRKLLYQLLESAENNDQRIKRSLNNGDKEDIKSGEANDKILKLLSRKLPGKIKRDIQNIEHDTVASVPGELYPETAMHNLEQLSDKVESHIDKKSEIPTQETRNDKTFRQKTGEDNTAVYNIAQDVALEIPMTTQVHKHNTRVEKLSKRDTVSQNQGSIVMRENKVGSQDTSVDRQKKKSGTMKDKSRRRDEVPGANLSPSFLDDVADENFQVRDKSADLEIHADSSGVRVKAKPASLQVVSNPHGDVKTLEGETHAEGMMADRRTFTPVLPGKKHTRHHHHLFPGLEPRTFKLRHYHRFHRHHRLPWLRHRQHINYPDVFERMRFQNPVPQAPSPFSLSSEMGLPFTQPITSMMNAPLPIMYNSGTMGGERMGGGMGGPLIPQLLQRSPIMEGSPSNRFGGPENPMGELPSIGGMASPRFSPMEEINPMGRMNIIGGMLPRDVSPMGEMSPMGRMPTMADMSPMDHMGQIEQMDKMMNSMPGMSPSSPFNQGPLHRKNALEFWGMPNQDQVRALARGEDVQKVLGSNKYGESLGGITGGEMGMNYPVNMGGPSFNANGMEDIEMMRPYGGTRSAMFNGMRGPMSMMDSSMRPSSLYKKDDINKTDEYKKSIQTKKSRDKTAALYNTKKNTGKKFEKGIMEKAESLVAGEKHIAKNEETTLHREHRIRKSSKLAHDEEKRSLPQKEDVKNNSVKHEKTKNVKGSKKDVTVQRPPIIYHPPPEVYHRPDIVMHRAPVLFQRPPIVYHQAPVVIHRPAVVYRQPPIVFHQPSPVVNQPYYRAADNFMMHPAYSHVGSHVAQSYNYMGLPSEVMGYKKEVVPSKPTTKGKTEKKSKRGKISHEKSKRNKNEKVAQKKKKDVVVNRPPIIYHPPPEVYHRPQIVVHRAPLLIRRPPIVYHQPAVIVHRPPVVYHQPPIVFHQPAPTVNQPVLYSHDNFVVHPSFFATHHGSIVSDAGRLLGIPNTISVPDTEVFPYEPVRANSGYAPGGVPGEIGPLSPAGAMPPPFMGRRKRSLKRNKAKHITAKLKNAVPVKRPPIVHHPSPKVYHQPNIVVHPAPLVIHRSPIVHHRPPVVIHHPSVRYHRPLGVPNRIVGLASSIAPQPSAVVGHSVLNQVFAFGRSKVPQKIHNNEKQHKSRRDVVKEDKKASKTSMVMREDRTEKASKKNAVLVKRPPIIYHPPPEVYHRPDIVVHRAPIVIHRAPLVYHQPPVVVHRPAVVYHQPAVVFHQPPPMVHQPLFTAHDTFTPHNTLSLGGSSTSKVGDFEGPPLDTLATRKGEVPMIRKENSQNTILMEETAKNKAGYSYEKSKAKSKNSHRHSHLRKLILSIQNDHSKKKSGGLQVPKTSQVVLLRPAPILSSPAIVVPLLGKSTFTRSSGQPLLEAHSVIQRVSIPAVRPVVVPLDHHKPASAVYHHNLPIHFHHHHLQPLLGAPHAISTAHLVTEPHQAADSDRHYSPYSSGKSEILLQNRKGTIHVHDFGVPVHGHIGHVAGNSHVLNHHGYVVHHTDCPVYCGTCYPKCSFNCKPYCISIIHHQHHQPHHVFANHYHHHDSAQTHLHHHHWPVHHHDMYYSHLYHPYRHIGHQQGIHILPYHLRRRRDTAEKNSAVKTMVPHYKVYQHVKHWHPPCIHNSQICHHHHHPMTVYHDHYHPTSVMHHHHYQPYPVYHHHEHVKPVIYHHIKPYLIHHHHNHHTHDTWHHDHYHVPPPKPYPVPVEVPVVVPAPVQIPTQMICSYPIPHCQLYPTFHNHGSHHISRRYHIPHKKTKKSETTKPEKETRKTKNRKKDVVVNRPPIIYHPPPEVYHRPEIVVHRAPVLVHRPPIVYHQSSVIVHRPPVVYHQPPVVFHQPFPTVNQPVLYSHDNFVVHPTMLARHAGTMVESAGHFLGLPSGPINNFPGGLSTYGGEKGVGMESYATPFQRKRRSVKKRQEKLSKHFQKVKSSSKTANRKNAIVVHRPPVIYHPPPEIYHRPRIVVHRPDVLIHRPPIVYHQAPVVLHRPPVVYHQTPIVFHQPPPMVNQAVYHAHDSYTSQPVFTHYNSNVHHVGAYQGVPQYGEYYPGSHREYSELHGVYPKLYGGFTGMHASFGGHGGLFGGFGGVSHGFGRSKIEKPKKKKEHYKKIKTKKNLSTKKSEMTMKSSKSEHAHRKHSVVVHRPPIIFHPAPEVYHRPAYVIHQPDVVIHRPPVVYHQSPVVVHHPAVAYHQHPIIVHQRPPLIVQPIYAHHQFYQCIPGWYGCGAGFGPGGFSRFGAFGGLGHGGLGHGVFGGFGGLYGKSTVPKHKHFKSHSKKPRIHSTEQIKPQNKAKKEHVEETKGSKKNEIVIHRPPLVYHPPPEIYHRPDIVVHRPDVLIHRPSVVYDQPAVVLHRPAVIYHEPPVVFHQPPPMVNRPIFHASDMYAPHPIYTNAGSLVDFDHNTEGIPPHFSYGPYGVSNAFGKSKIENHSDTDNREIKSEKVKKNFVKENVISKHNKRYSTTKYVLKKKLAGKSVVSKDSEESTISKQSEKSKHHSSNQVQTSNAHKKYHLVMHRPPIVYHSSPTVYHRPDVVVHQPDIVIHRPSVVVQPPSVVVHKPAVVYHQPSVVFHQALPEINQPIYHSHDAYAAHSVFLPSGTYLEHREQYIGHPGYGFMDDLHGDAHGFGFYGHISDVLHHGFSVPGYPGSQDFAGLEKSKIQENEKVLENKHVREYKNQLTDSEKNKPKHEAKNEKHKDMKSKRDTEAKNTKRVELPRAQKEKTETGTKKNAIMVRRPPIIYHPPPEVYHRPDIVVHRAPIVIQRAPLVYHQSPVIVHRPAVVYHQPAVVFHQPAPTVHQPLYHSLDSFQVHPHLSFSHAGSNIHQIGQYLGIPQEVMHRSKIEHFHPPLVKNLYPKQRRSTLEQLITPVTPFNFIRPHNETVESPRSTLPYPTLNAFHPHTLSYTSFPWGHFPRISRSVEESSHLDLVTQVAPKLLPPSYSTLYHHALLTRPHVDVNIETVKSYIPRSKHRYRRQSTWDSSQVPATANVVQSNPIHYIPTMLHSVLQRPPVNVNIETINSAAPRMKRQVLAGLPVQETQNLPAPAQAFAQTAVPVAPIQLSPTNDQSGVSISPVQLPMAHPPDQTLGVYRDLLRAIYPRGVHRRPKVNIVVQTAKSNIARPVKKSVVPSSLRRENVDAFRTMPEVTTIEPPLLRDGVRVNMVDLGDPTARSINLSEAPRLPTYNDLGSNIQNLGTIVPGLGGQGNFGMDKLKKSSISQPSLAWHDVNAEKKSAVHGPNQNVVARKRYSISGFQTSPQFSQYPPGSPADYSVEPLSSPPLAQPPSAGYTSDPLESQPTAFTTNIQRSWPHSAPAAYTPEPQGAQPAVGEPENVDSQANLAQLETTSYDGQSRIVAQPERSHVDVNIDTIKKQTLRSSLLPSKRQLIGTLPLTTLFLHNPNTAKASLKSSVPSNAQSSKPVTKRQQIFRRVPLAQAIPPLRHRVVSSHISHARPLTHRYSASPVHDSQTLFHTPRAFSFLGVQPASPQKVLPAPHPYVKPILPQASQAVTPSPFSYKRPALFPWGGHRGRVNINIETTKPKIPTKSAKIITQRFKRKFPVLYSIIKAKARSEKTGWKTLRDKRQIPIFSEGFFQNLMPNANELAKRALYGGVSRYSVQPAMLYTRARRLRPQSSEKAGIGTIEVGRNDAGSPLASAASLLKNEFSQNFDDIAKIQRQEVKDIKGMSVGRQPFSSSQVLSLPGQESPGAQDVTGQPSRMISAPDGASAVPLPEQVQQRQPEVVPVSSQQQMASFADVPLVLSAAEQALPAQFSSQKAPPQAPVETVSQAPVQIAPGFVRGKPQPLMEDAQLVPESVLQTSEPAIQAPERAVSPSKNSFTEVPIGQHQLPGFFPQLPLPSIQFPFLSPAELSQVALPYARPVFNSIPQSEDESDRPSVNIQVQTSKSKIPKLKTKKKHHSKNVEGTH